VIGHSGATGYESDEGTVDASARQNAADGRENSWATGTNPAVDSIYQRLVAKSPEYSGHQFNLAADGATVTDMIAQAAYLPQVKPAPAVVFVQGGDNDMKCDGTDAQNYAPFQASFTSLLQSIAKLAPAASIYVMSMTISAASYTDLISGLPDVKAQNEGGSPCDPFDANGNRSAAGIAYQQDDIDHYDKAMAAACAAVQSCHYDNGAMQRLSLVPADLTSDGNHLDVTGLRKYADLVWSTFFSG
jgi:lysophospholipase L1-like esterase